MIDRELELEVRGWFAAEFPTADRAPEGLRADVLAIPRMIGRPFVPRRYAYLAAAAALAVSLLVAFVLGPGSPRPSIAPTAVPSPTSSPHSTIAAWTEVGTMVEPRLGSALGVGGWAVRLADGRVLISGGVRSDALGPAIASAEIFDPKSGVWMTTGSMIVARTGHTLTTLPDGRVLAAGGTAGGSGGRSLASAELYDPATGTWSMTGSMGGARAYHTATPLADGRVLVAGGVAVDGANPLASAEIFDPTTGTWAPTGNMGEARWLHAAARLDDARVMVVGHGHLAGSPTAELFDPTTGRWSYTGAMAAMRGSGATLVVLPNRGVMVLGGQRKLLLKDPTIGPELYDPATAHWQELVGKKGAPPPMSVAGPPESFVPMAAAAILGDGRLLVEGVAGTFIYDPSTDTWTQTVSPPPSFLEVALPLSDGRVLGFGVDGAAAGSADGETWIFDPRDLP
jgi:Galactose oxidase, central domain/Kelch motif